MTTIPDNKIVPFPPGGIPYHRQAYEVPGTKRPGETGIYRNGIWDPLTIDTPNAFITLYQIFEHTLKANPNRNFLGHRPVISKKPLQYDTKFVWETYAQVDQRRKNVGSALHALFASGQLGGGDFKTVGIWSQNRPEWQVTELALHAYEMVSVSLYDTLGGDAVDYIMDHSHVTVVFTTSDHIPLLLKSKPKFLKLIVSMDDLTEDAKKLLNQWGQTKGLEVKDLRELEAIGKANPVAPIPAKPEQLATICYTSGTTGNPKGVLLAHSALALANQSNMYGFQVDSNSALLSYLPLAHIYERICEIGAMSVGARIGYFTGDPLRLLEDAQILKPEFFPSVPRVLNRIYISAMAAGNVPGLRGNIFKKAVAAKLERLKTTGVVTHALWDRLVFRKIRAVLGGRLLLVGSGAAPINPDVMDFLKIALACDVIEGYGMTETSATCSKCIPGDPTSSGTIGPVQPVNECKLLDVPSMGYTANDKPFPRGELLVRGANCFNTYYNEPEKTREAVDEEGWVHTGDVAAIDDCGRLRIIDRVKNIMKLAQGEYVALEKIENTYSACPVIAQLYVHGDGTQSYLIAVVVPDPIAFAALVSKRNKRTVEPTDITELAKAAASPEVTAEVFEILRQEAKKNQLKGFETIKRIHLTMDAFTIEDGTLTPTMKLKRKDAYNKFKKELDGLYSLGEPKL